jgi:hypothetical protein
MYTKPVLERFGNFRELTLVGLDSVSDLTVLGVSSPGCSTFGIAVDCPGS